MREIDYREECPKTHTKNKIQFITRKQKHQLEGNVVPAGYSHTNAHYAGGVNLNSNHTKYLAQLCGRFFCVLEYFRCKFANLVAPPTDKTAKCLVCCKVLQVL